jgi:hypothetical protein
MQKMKTIGSVGSDPHTRGMYYNTCGFFIAFSMKAIGYFDLNGGCGHLGFDYR